jgi:hypothetical protein
VLSGAGWCYNEFLVERGREVATILYGRAAIEAQASYMAYADVNHEYVLMKVRESEGVTLTWEEFERRWYKDTQQCADEWDEDFQLTLINRYGDAAVELEIESDTAEEDERQMLAWMREIMRAERYCGVYDWGDAPLPENRAGLALQRAVKKGLLVQTEDYHGTLYRLPSDFEVSLNVMCYGCNEDFGWIHRPTALHKECARALVAALNAALGDE